MVLVDMRAASGLLFASCLVLSTAASAQPSKKAAKTAKPAAPAPAPLVVLETTTKPRADYEAEVFAGVRLDDAYAKERGLSKGLVYMVFEKERRGSFRVARDRIKRVVRFAADDVAPLMLVRASTASAPASQTRIDVLDTEDGTIVVETQTTNAGIFTTSQVYAFKRGMTLDQMKAALAAAPAPSRDRVVRALAQAQRA